MNTLEEEDYTKELTAGVLYFVIVLIIAAIMVVLTLSIRPVRKIIINSDTLSEGFTSKAGENTLSGTLKTNLTDATISGANTLHGIKVFFK